MSIILLLARFILFVVFAIAGIAKLADPRGSRKSIAEFGIPKSLTPAVAWLLPLAELVCAAALLPLASAWWAAAGVLLLLLAFIAGISLSLIRGRRPDCHCFGQLHSAPIGWPTLLRNAALAALSLCILAQGPANPGASIVEWTRGLPSTESGIAILSIAVFALAAFEFWMLVHILRQNGRLLLRVEALEARSGNAEAPPQGLPVNTPAPPFTLPGLFGEPVSLAMLLERHKPVLLLFTEPGCPACDSALPEVARWQREHADLLSIVPVSRGDLKENRARTAKHNLHNVLLQTDREVAHVYQALETPSAVLVKDGRIESPLAVGSDAIRALVARATLPDPVNAGDPVPSLRLPDLSGELIDLAQLQNRRTMMLFWSPSCGFCQQMLEDLKAWEHDPKKDAPELLVISAGAPDDNRKQGFRSRVLLDPDYAASHVFNSGGTPSAVIVEKGRVASSVAVGAQAVWALTGR